MTCTDMDWSSVEPLDFEKFRTHFAHGHVYYLDRSKWPNETIIFAHVEINQKNERTLMPWKRYVNEPQKHAEITFLDDIRQYLEYADYNCELKLHLMMSYSPCVKCVEAIIHFKTEFEKYMTILKIKIQFSNFYKGYEMSSLKGIAYLDRAGIDVDILNGFYNWNMFMKNINITEISLFLNAALDINRIERENVDREILQAIFLYNKCLAMLARFPHYVRMRMVITLDECLDSIGKSQSEEQANEIHDISVALFERVCGEDVERRLAYLKFCDFNPLFFKNHFAVEHRYSTGNIYWPRKTVLFFELKLDGKLIDPHMDVPRFDGYCDAEPQFHSIQRLVNTLRQNYMLQRITVSKVFHLQIFANYSPCGLCVEELLKVKGTLGKNMEVNISIKFSNFYVFNMHESLLQLARLDRSGVVIGVFYGFRDWFNFLCRIGCLCKYDIDTFTDSTINVRRKNRETVDKRILEIVFLYNQAIQTPAEPALNTILYRIRETNTKEEIKELHLKAAHRLQEVLLQRQQCRLLHNSFY